SDQPVLFSRACRPARDLHPFPTRRSSDLSSKPTVAICFGEARRFRFKIRPKPQPMESRWCTRSVCWPRTCPWLKISSSAASRDRSEEHTSELQSRSDLVCRLLLEKKKTTP